MTETVLVTELEFVKAEPIFRAESELEVQCVAEGLGHDLLGLKGHRSVGGMRASIYNAMSIEGVRALRDHLIDFQERNE